MIPRISHPKPFFNPAAVFLLLGLLSGVAYCIFIPYGAGFDEEQHLARILDLSTYHWLPNNNPPGGEYIYPEILTLSYQRRYFLEPAYDLLEEKFTRRNDHDHQLFFTTRSIYNPIIFLPQALIVRWFWQKYDYPFIPVTILCRLAGFFIYLAGSYLAVRIIPVGKWVMAALALSPMAMFQAATLSTDGFTNASCFLFIAFALQWMLNGGPPADTQNDLTGTAAPKSRAMLLKSFRNWEWEKWGLAASIILLGLSKAGGMLLLPILLFLPYHKFRSRKLLWIVIAAVLLAFALSIGWSAISIPTSHFILDENGQNLNIQSSVIFSHLLDFLRSVVKEYTSNFWLYFRNWLASYGHWVGIVPQAIFWLYPLALIGALIIDPPHPELTLRRRFILAGVSLAATLVTALFFYGLFYKPSGAAGFGRQGRYFISTLPLLLLALSGLEFPRRLPAKWLSAAIITVLGLVTALYAYGLYANYYTYCDSTYYTFQTCEQPIYKQLDLDTAPTAQVHTGSALTQTFSSICGEVKAVRVRALDIPAEPAGALTISLFDQNGSQLASQKFQLSDLTARQYIELPVETLVSPAGPVYHIRLESMDIPSTRPLTLVASTENQYRDGSLSINGVEQPNDLILKFLCVGYWEQIFH